jgi:hypothetical protein
MTRSSPRVELPARDGRLEGDSEVLARDLIVQPAGIVRAVVGLTQRAVTSTWKASGRGADVPSRSTTVP